MSIETDIEGVKKAQQEVYEASRVVNPDVPVFGGAVIMSHVPYAGEAPPAPEVKPDFVQPNYPA